MERLRSVRISLTGNPGDGVVTDILNLEFVPDEMIIESYCYYSGAFVEGEANPLYGTLPSQVVGEVYMSLINERIFIFTDSPTVYFPNKRFKLGPQFSGAKQVTFTFLDMNNGIYDGTAGRVENLRMELRFIKYK
jgi:hypothetical protein